MDEQKRIRKYFDVILSGKLHRWAILAVVLCGATSSYAQERTPESFLLQQRRLEEDIRALRRQEATAADRAFFDYGGWYSFHLFIFDDGVESSRVLRRHDLRLWSRLRLDEGAHEFYLRGRVSLLDFNTGDAYDGNDDDVEGMNLERGVYRFDLAKALGGYDVTDGRNLTVVLGRDLVEIGTGLTLSAPLDHVGVTWSDDSWRLRGLAGRTVGSLADLDRTRPIDRSRRAFFGAEITYTGFERHEPFVYALWQRDHNRETRPVLLQQYDYDSFYVGVGSTGEVAPRWGYRAEWVYESGRSFGHRRFIEADIIEAWAFDAELEYRFPGAHQARAAVEYLFASGDAQRRGSPTDASGGNMSGREDSGFNGFGYRDTGLSLAPALSNVHILRTGTAFYPFPDIPKFARLEVGADSFLYFKNHRRGAISDSTAPRHSSYLGWELDTFANWAVSSDVAWTVRFGVFLPGDAFDDRSPRTFFLTGITWSF